MRRRLLILAGLLSLAACAARGVDAPLPVEAGYGAREAANLEDGDRCGPAVITEAMPGWLANAVGPVTDGPFRPVCGRHDACYRLGEQTQSWCDERMRTEMEAICATGEATAAYSAPIVGPSLCRFHAAAYYRAIDTTYGGFSYGGAPGGAIESVSREARGSDVVLCAQVHNPTPLMQEYDLELRTASGQLVDREPDLHELNIRPGETREICVGTHFDPFWSAARLGEGATLSLRADTPESFAFINDMVVVDFTAAAGASGP